MFPIRDLQAITSAIFVLKSLDLKLPGVRPRGRETSLPLPSFICNLICHGDTFGSMDPIPRYQARTKWLKTLPYILGLCT